MTKLNWPNVLKAWQRAHSMSNSEIARSLSISPSTVGNWLKGTALPSTESCRDLAKMMGADVGLLVDAVGVAAQALEDDELHMELHAGEWTYIDDNGVQPGRLRWRVRIKGNCMEPEYPDGSLVMFDKAKKVEVGDDVYVQMNDGHAIFHRLVAHVVDGKGAHLSFKPLNPSMPKVVTVHGWDLAQVVGVARRPKDAA
jgi:SOS-response transcriptional repressor LexA